MKQLQKTSKKISAFAQYKSLSIQFSLDGFSFYVSNSETKEPLLFTKYAFTKTIASPELLLEKVIAIFDTDKDLQQDFTSVFAIHQNNLATIVPNELFDRNNLAPYLKYTVKTLKTDFITYDLHNIIAANTVYIPYVNINNFIFQNFGEFEYKHHSTVLIDKLLSYSEQDSEEQFFVHVSPNYVDLVVCKEGRLLFYNSFNYTTKEDFIYYILFTAEQLQMNPNYFQLTFTGDIEKESDLYDITYNYVRNIHFINPIDSFFADSEDFSNHSNFILTS
ncbi:DUF3822 family protein [Tenacibaculum tangerinum]|uniref:DUF3822 family protein n=1 Tax=Tenacibaculum tangerinum TaxID=3038772 RepID=A0ABY8L6A9_9FLAO|nr:DUF3822 family protein [Tenacibaculum tangerinum]WGH75733.1 DUF3822 family protein [Tenacibaculum tangerinum]